MTQGLDDILVGLPTETFHFFYRCGRLSQWGKSTFVYEDIKFCCAEQAMMYFKAILHVKYDVNNSKIADKIMDTEYPFEHQRLGRSVNSFNQAEWDVVCDPLVYEINYAKFKQNTHLREYILNIKEDTLVEASPVDAIWGIKLAADDPRALNRSTWKGANKLGNALTKVRNQLVAELG